MVNEKLTNHIHIVDEKPTTFQNNNSLVASKPVQSSFPKIVQLNVNKAGKFFGKSSLMGFVRNIKPISANPVNKVDVSQTIRFPNNILQKPFSSEAAPKLPQLGRHDAFKNIGLKKEDKNIKIPKAKNKWNTENKVDENNNPLILPEPAKSEAVPKIPRIQDAIKNNGRDPLDSKHTAIYSLEGTSKLSNVGQQKIGNPVNNVKKPNKRNKWTTGSYGNKETERTRLEKKYEIKIKNQKNEIKKFEAEHILPFAAVSREGMKRRIGADSISLENNGPVYYEKKEFHGKHPATGNTKNQEAYVKTAKGLLSEGKVVDAINYNSKGYG